MDIEHERPEFYEALGRTIQVVRTDQGLDRKDLADRAGISYSYLAAIENGKKPPSSKVLFAIAGALGLLSHELLASVENRVRRQRQPAVAPLRFAAPSARQAWFHAASPGSGRVAPQRASADWAGYGDLSPTPRPSGAPSSAVPYSTAGFLMELERLNPLLSDEDRDLVLGLARRLASDE
ncbi:MAG: DNA-binding protein [Actinobacteria bacterium]|nr:DNA-binding protein [Actinomycetota bacterium]